MKKSTLVLKMIFLIREKWHFKYTDVERVSLPTDHGLNPKVLIS